MPEAAVVATMKIKSVDLDEIMQDQGLDKQVYRIFKILKQFQCSDRDRYIKRRESAWEAIENKILSDEDEKQMADAGQDVFHLNKINKGVQGAAAIVTDQKPEMKFLPIGSGDLYVSELIKRAHDLVWEKNEGADEVYRLVEEAKIGGIGVAVAYHEPTKGPFGRVIFEESDPTNFYWSPKSRKRDLSDTHIIKAIRRTTEYIKSKYPKIQDSDIEFDIPVSQGGSGEHDTKTAEDQYASGDGADSGVMDDQKCVWEVEAWLLETLTEHINIYIAEGQPVVEKFLNHAEAMARIAETGGEHVMRPRVVRRQVVVVGKTIVSDKINPYGEDSDGDPILPIVVLPHYRTRNSYPMSPTAYAVEINRMKIKSRAKFEYGVAQTVNSPVVRPTNCKWTGNPGTPGTELIVDKNVAFQPYRLGSGSANMQLFRQLEEMADRDIDDQYDLQDVMRGKMDGKMAWQTVYALQEFGGMMSKPFLRSLESALVRLAKVNVALIMEHWTRQMWERLIEPEEMLQWVPNEEKAKLEQIAQQNSGQVPQEIQMEIHNRWLDALEQIRPSDPMAKPGISLIDIDVKIIAGSSMPTSRMAKLQVAMDLVGRGIYDIEAALDYIDDPNKDQIIERRKQQMQMQEQAAMMQQGG